MAAKLEKISPTLVKMHFEVPVADLETYFDRVYKILANQVKVPGFRPGKAPSRIIESHVGRETIVRNVINDAVPALYSQGVEKEKIKPIGQPEIEVLSDLSAIDGANPLSFTAGVEVRPELKIPDLKTTEVKVDAVKVEDKDIDKALEEIQKRFATLKDSDKSAAKGDVVVLDVEAKVDGKKVTDASARGITHEAGSGELIKGLDETVLGLKKGESGTFKSRLLSGTKAGDEADFTVKVTSVKTRELPKLDDGFVSMASEFDTLADFKKDIAKKVEQQKEIEQSVKISDEFVDQLLKKLDIPVPERIFNQQFDAQNQQVLSTVGFDKERLAKVLEAEDKTPASFEKELKDNIDKSIRSQILLDALADDLKIEVDQAELANRIVLEAQKFRMNPQQFAAQLQQTGQVATLYAELSRTKALTKALNEIKVVDEKGNTIDISKLFPVSKPEAKADKNESKKADKK